MPMCTSSSEAFYSNHAAFGRPALLDVRPEIV